MHTRTRPASSETLRKLICLALVIVFLAGSLAEPVLAKKAETTDDAEWQKVSSSAKLAVKYLLSQQQKNGAIVDNNRHHTTMTSLAIMAMLAVGHKPADKTPEGEAMRKALDYVLHQDRQDEKGYFGNKDGSRMYGHGIITLMLAEAYGMGVDDQQDATIRKRLQKAVDLILRAQAIKKNDPKHEGGWRYNPDSSDSDLSVVSWQLIALRAAKGAGLDIPKEAIDKAVAYVKRCYHKDSKDKTKGYFCYQAGDSTMRFGSAAGGFLTLQICGEYEAPEVIGAADYFLDYDIPSLQAREHFYYGMYYYAQGMFQRRGKYAERAKQVVRDLLLARQEKDGSWPLGVRDHEGGKVYVTSLAMLSMSIHFHYLPIYQR
ncbi:MAG: prenyltransferase/squalene oxidase repeat-containing protein [Planctomycetota bacterium]